MSNNTSSQLSTRSMMDISYSIHKSVEEAFREFGISCNVSYPYLRLSTIYYPQNGSRYSGWRMSGWETVHNDEGKIYIQVGILTSSDLLILAWTKDEQLLDKLKTLGKELTRKTNMISTVYWGRELGEETETWNLLEIS